MLAPGVLLCPTLHTSHLHPVYLLWEGAGFGAPQALEVASQLTVTLPQTVSMIPSSLKATTTYSYITTSAEHPLSKKLDQALGLTPDFWRPYCPCQLLGAHHFPISNCRIHARVFQTILKEDCFKRFCWLFKKEKASSCFPEALW